jgi:arylsulfatase A-like enzyme
VRIPPGPSHRPTALAARHIAFALAATVTAAVTVAAVPSRAAAAPSGDSGRSPKHVLLIDWDGFDPDYLGRVATPNLDALSERGSLTIGSSTFQTVSNPARASMVTGAYPDTHENAAYYLDPASNTVKGQERNLEAETIAEALAEEGRTVAAVQWYMVQDHGTSFGDPEHLYVQPGGDFGDRVDVAIDILHQRPVDSGGIQVTVPQVPELLAVYGSDLDELAHAEGAESPDIGARLAEMDAELGRLVQATKDVGIYGETAVILTSDHGMTSWNRTLLPQVLDAVSTAGYVAEVVTPGQSPAPTTEVVLVPNAVRYGNFYLRGRAATEQGRADVRAALESMAPAYVAQVLDDADLEAMRASDKLGDLIAEAQPPYAFALTEPPAGQTRGAHGSTQELAVPFLLSGAGVCRGAVPASPSLVDVAPTIAALLGVTPPDDVEGRVLTEALDPQSSPGAASSTGR